VARREGTLLKAYPPISFTINVTGGESMRYRVERKDPIRIAGVRVALKEDQEHNFQMVPKFWKEAFSSNLVSKISKLRNQKPPGILGVTVYKNPEEIYYYIAVSTDQAVSENLYEYEIPAATWVIFEGNGRFPDSIQTIFRRFLTEWLPFSGYEYAHLPDIEVYPSNQQIAQSGYSEVWIAVKKPKQAK
ncbi:MAG: effector binding domain-containing protein, partial [Halanaerobiales bacterium]|nr:effector binding domain-containing protein [Halanaerobiales bacterium]